MRKYTFQNTLISKKQLKQILAWTFTNYGSIKASNLADELKHLGFNYSTEAGLSISIEDLRIPPIKNSILENSNNEVSFTEKVCFKGNITEVERFQKVIDTWGVTSERLKDEVVCYFQNYDPLNSVYMMAFSGARGNLSQVRQLVGMRGLMSDPNGEIMDLPIKQNFREGLTITDYLMSGYGARKGIVDTALKTANSGYLTRRLIDIAQDIIIREKECLSNKSIIFTDIEKDSIKVRSHYDRILGRVLNKTIFDLNNKILIKKGTELNSDSISLLKENNISKILIRSPLTCTLNRSVCQNCYGWSLANENLVNLGEAIGIIAGQSIGEPGTQLTMRTFHTGGIFTGGSNQELISSVNGILNFSKFLKTVFFRTKKGENVLKTLNSGSLVITYKKNKNIKIEIPSETLLFIKNNSKIKKGELLGELNGTNKQIKVETKTIISNISAEVSTKMSDNLIWLLKGKLFNLQINSYLNFYLKNKILKNNFISRTKIINNQPGIINIIRNKIDLSEQIVQILSNPINLKNFKVQKVVNYLNPNRYLLINNGEKFLLKPTFINKKQSLLLRLKENFAKVITNQYNTLIGGTPYFLNEKKNSLLWISEETHSINRDSNVLLIENNEFIPENYEIVENTFSTISGITEIIEKNNIIQEIRIKPGFLHKNKNYNKFNKTIYYPGEILFNNLKLTQISLSEITIQRSGPEILIRPLLLYQILNDSNLKTSKKKNLIIDNLFEFKSILKSSIVHKRKIKAYQSIELFEENLELNLLFKRELSNTFDLEIFGQINSNNTFELMLSEKLYLPNYIPKELKTSDIKISLIVEKNQFINKHSVIGYIELITLNDIKIIKIKNRIEKNRRLFIIRDSDCFTVPYKNLIDKNLGDFVTNTNSFKKIGKIILKKNNYFFIQKGYPYLFLKGAVLFCKNGDLIEKDQKIGILKFEKEITGDIVQGLPRVEEILEARKIKKSITPLLINKTGLTPEYRFRKLGDCLGNKENVNPHEFLNLYFQYYTKFENIYEATYRSFKKVQALILNLIQEVYQSQGVTIADKHLEVIVKQMTTKVKIYHEGSTPLFPNEIIDLHYVNYINQAIKIDKKQIAFYEPILLGITKASLNTESFISAASFQETTKVLTKATIEGKTDWLRGLKENVILGRLIPVGTGFDKLN